MLAVMSSTVVVMVLVSSEVIIITTKTMEVLVDMMRPVQEEECVHDHEDLLVVTDGIKHVEEQMFPEIVDRSCVFLEQEEDVNVAEMENMLLFHLCVLQTNFEDGGVEFLANLL